MVFNAKNGKIAGAEYIRFGTGQRVLIMLPGLGDGLKTVGGTALPMARRIWRRPWMPSASKKPTFWASPWAV